MTNAYQALFEYASVGILISNRSGVIEQVNPFLSQMFGFRPEELIGKRIETLIPVKQRENHVGLRADYNKNPQARAMGISMDLVALKKDGTVFPVEISLAFYEQNGERKIVSFVNDITQRKKAQEDLKQLNAELEAKVADRTKDLSQALFELTHVNESLEEEIRQRKKIEAKVRKAFEKEKELGEFKSQFVSMASHEFRTPLSGILTSASLIRRYNQKGEAEKIEKHLQTIKTSVRNLTSILNDFLSLDRLEAGKATSHPVLFAVDGFVKDLVQEMESLLKKDQRIFYEHHGSHRRMKADQELLRNILINLFSNAIRYSPEGSQIFLRTGLKNSKWTITLRDEGIGIPLSDQKHLFERFFRAKNVSATQGTGLGLHIVKQYLDLMGGTIQIISEENQGTTVTITLPL